MRKGFTLVELLIVMAVIAILIGIAIPSFRGMQQEAWKTQAQGDVRVLKIAVESYYKNNGSYPTALTDLTATTTTPKIIEKDLLDPFSGGAYNYALDTGTPVKYYVIFSKGANQTASTNATVNSSGVVTLTNSSEVIYSTNGHLAD